MSLIRHNNQIYFITLLTICLLNFKKIFDIIQKIFAGMVELADTQDLGSCAERCTGSTPATRTKIITPTSVGVIF